MTKEGEGISAGVAIIQCLQPCHLRHVSALCVCVRVIKAKEKHVRNEGMVAIHLTYIHGVPATEACVRGRKGSPDIVCVAQLVVALCLWW